MAQITIQEKETLSGIASRFNTDIFTLQSLNPQIADPNLIIAGQQLNVPDIREPALIDTEDFRTDAQANQERIAEITRQIEESQATLAETREQLRVQLAEEAEAVPSALDEAEKAELGITIKPEEQAEQTRIEEATKELDSQQSEIDRTLDQLSIQADANATALIQGIKVRFAQRRVEQENINKRSRAALEQLGIRAGAARRAGSFVGIVSAEERAGLSRITDLDRQESELILAAKEAARTEKFDILSQKMEAVESKREQINKEITKFNEAVIERNKEIREELEQITREASIMELIDLGLTNPLDIAEKLRIPIEDAVSVLKNLPSESIELVGKARELQSFVNVGLIDSTLPITEQWKQFIDLTMDDPLLTDAQLKIYRVPFGTRQSAILGKFPIPPEEGVDLPLSSTEIRQTREQVNASKTLLSLLNEYRDIVSEKGFTNKFFGDKVALGRIDSLRAQMTAAYKDAKKLGTLDEGLLTLMESLLGVEPISGLWPFKNLFGGPATRIVSSIDSLIDTTQQELTRGEERLGISGGLITSEDERDVDEILGTFAPETFFE